MLIPLAAEIEKGNELHIARALSWAENQHPEIHPLLKKLHGKSHIIGVTGPPGAGKSTLVNALVTHWRSQQKRVAILAVDPSSAFNFGSLLGDRLRMQTLFLNEGVFIRSVSSRGSLGGLSAHIIEMIHVLKHAPYDYILVETVGVGQSEVEIAGIADTTVVVSVPESGDEIQTLKSGIMEIADIFVVNKSDRDGAESFASHLRNLAHTRATEQWENPVILTQADQSKGIELLAQALSQHEAFNHNTERQILLFAEKSFAIIQEHRMRDLSLAQIQSDVRAALEENPDLNLFEFIEPYFLKYQS